MILTGNSTSSVTFYSTERKINFSTYVGDTKSSLLSIATTKNMNEASGTFQIQLTPEKDSQGLTWFDKIGIWDFVEIKLKGILDKEEIVVMRGFVDTISYSEEFAGGVPQRSISISGRDLGCLLTDFSIYMIPELGEEAAAEALIGGPVWFKAVQKGVMGSAKEVFKFLVEIFFDQIDLIISDKGHVLGYLDWEAESFFSDLSTYLGYLKSYEGPWWNAFSQYQDKPFHEMFIYDTVDRSLFIFRPARLRDCNNAYPQIVRSLITNEKMYPPDWEITNNEKISMTVSKTVSEIKNYYLSIPTLNIIAKQDFRGQAISANFDNPKNSKNPYFQMDPAFPSYLKKYGFRSYEFETVYMDLDIGQEKGQGTEYVAETRDIFVKAGEALNKTLVAWFLHNPLLLNGTLTIAGTNRAIIGTYMVDHNEGMRYYIETVSHNFITLQSFTTTVGLVRGVPLIGLPEGSNKETF